MRYSEFNVRPRYAIGFVVGLIMFVGAPEGIRLFNGGAIAQQSLIPNNTIIGNTITGPSSFSATSGPGQTGPVVGGESNVTVCPGQNGQAPNAVGTYVAPGGSLSASVSANGGGGSVTGYRSSVTVGGPGCK
jgi:hypothetical protein